MGKRKTFMFFVMFPPLRPFSSLLPFLSTLLSTLLNCVCVRQSSSSSSSSVCTLHISIVQQGIIHDLSKVIENDNNNKTKTKHLVPFFFFFYRWSRLGAVFSIWTRLNIWINNHRDLKCASSLLLLPLHPPALRLSLTPTAARYTRALYIICLRRSWNWHFIGHHV